MSYRTLTYRRLPRVEADNISGLEEVIHDNLRPPDKNPSMQTKGRKSSTKKCVSHYLLFHGHTEIANES